MIDQHLLLSLRARLMLDWESEATNPPLHNVDQLESMLGHLP